MHSLPVLSIFTNYATLPLSNFRICSSPPKETPYPLAMTPCDPQRWPAHRVGSQWSHSYPQLEALGWAGGENGERGGATGRTRAVFATRGFNHRRDKSLPLALIPFYNHLNVPQKDHKFKVSPTELIFALKAFLLPLFPILVCSVIISLVI